jgi:hypothetical protein
MQRLQAVRSKPRALHYLPTSMPPFGNYPTSTALPQKAG